MPHDVKIYKPDGSLKKILDGKKLKYIDDPTAENSKKNCHYRGSGRERPETIVCQVCKRTVTFDHFKQRTCRRVECMNKMEEIKSYSKRFVKFGSQF